MEATGFDQLLPTECQKLYGEITATASSIGTEGYKFTTSKEVCISMEDIFHYFASSTNEDEFKNLCLLLY